MNLGADDNPVEEMVVVADGAGAHTGGRVASTHAVEAFTRSYLNNDVERPVRSRLKEALSLANDAIAEQGKLMPKLRGMGSTIIGVVFSRHTIHWISVGDSHLYRVRAGSIVKMNADHSFGGYIDQMRATGTYIDPSETMPRNTLLSALTGDRVPVIDCPDVATPVRTGDRYLVCSDGVNTLPIEMLGKLSQRARSASQMVDLTLSAIRLKAAPRQDNVTLVVVDVVTAARADAPADPGATTTDDPLAIVGEFTQTT